MRARFQVQSKGRQEPYMVMSFSEDVNLPKQVYVSGDVRSNGMIITAFKRQGSQPTDVRFGAGPFPRSVVLPWSFIGGYSDPSRIVPTNPLEIAIQPNDPVAPERWLIDPVMTQKKVEVPPVRVNGPILKLPLSNQNVPGPTEDPVPVFQQLRAAVRALNEVLERLPLDPVITVEGRKVKITVPLD